MLHAIIMAGGSGTRFWPKSRRDRPKQLLRSAGEATMLQQTVARIEPLVPRDRILIVTGADQAEATRAQLPDLPAENVIAEPCPRDTAPCVGLAAGIVAKKDPAATMIVMPADHVIEPAEAFRATVRAAVSVIDDDPSALVTFGIKPTHPETGYGYIERGALLETRDGIPVHRVVQFREKPDRATAERFLAAGNFAWNSGIFVWRARTILDETAGASPAARRRRSSRSCEALGTPDEAETLARLFPAARARADRQGRHGTRRQRARARGPLRLERRRRLASAGQPAASTTRPATRSRATWSRATRPARSSSPTTAAWSPRSASTTWSSSIRARRRWSPAKTSSTSSRPWSKAWGRRDTGRIFDRTEEIDRRIIRLFERSASRVVVASLSKAGRSRGSNAWSFIEWRPLFRAWTLTWNNQDFWPGFHGQALTAIVAQLVPQVTPAYVVRMEEQLFIHELPAEERRFLRTCRYRGRNRTIGRVRRARRHPACLQLPWRSGFPPWMSSGNVTSKSGTVETVRW